MARAVPLDPEVLGGLDDPGAEEHLPVAIDHDTSDERMGGIDMIAVDPVHQRAGIGSLLTTHALAWMKANGMRLAMVETGGDPGHAPARRTYEHAGFAPLPVVRYFREL